MATSQVGITIGADASAFEREMTLVGKSLDKIERKLKPRAGIKDMLGLRSAEKELRAVHGSLRNLTREYSQASRAVGEIEREHQRLKKSGKEITADEKARLDMAREALAIKRRDLGAARDRVQATREQQDENKSKKEQWQERWNRFKSGTSRTIGGGLQGLAALGTGNPGQTLTTALSAIPLIGPALGLIAGFGMQQYQMGRSTFIANSLGTMGARQLTGSGKGLGALGNIGLGLAYSRAETLNMAQSYAQATGGLGGFSQSLRLQRAFSLSPQALQGMLQAGRMGGANKQGIKEIQDALILAIRNGPFSRALATETAQAVGGLAGQRASAGLNTNMPQMIALLSSLGVRMGGAYAQSPQRAASVLGKLDASIRGGMQSPEEKKAFLYNAIRAQNPKLDHLGVMMQLEKGATSSNLNAVSKYAQSYVGKGVQGKRNLAILYADLFGMSATEAHRMVEGGGIGGLNDQMTGDADGFVSKEAARSQKGLGIYKRQLGLQEARANLAAKADPTMARIENLQLGAINKMADVAGKLENIFTGKNGGMMGVAKEAGKAAGEIIANAIRAVLPQWMKGSKDRRNIDPKTDTGNNWGGGR